MSALLFLTRDPSIQRLGWLLIHFLWEGTVIGLALAVLLPLLNSASAHVRYLVICLAMLACGIAPAVTWAVLARQDRTTFISPDAAAVKLDLGTYESATPSHAAPPAASRNPLVLPANTGEPIPAVSWRVLALRIFNELLPYTVIFWFCGVLILATRLTFGWAGMQRLRHSGEVISNQAWQERFRGLAERMRVSAPVRLLQSAFVEVPTLIGWLRPVILLPAAVFTGLTPEQLEAVLAHELAHVRRCDYLVNLLQTLIETALFYHPAVWWISRKLREEREVCCDDIVLEVMQDRLVYVSALARLEETRGASMALAASGGSLIRRIRRMADANDRKVTAWPLLVVIVGVVAVACLAKGKASEKAPSPEPSLSDILMKQANFFTGVNSLEYAEEKGSMESAHYQKTIWKEEGNKYAFDYRNIGGNDEFWVRVSYNGKMGFVDFPRHKEMFRACL